MIWWTDKQLPEVVTIKIARTRGGLVVSDDGYASLPETVRTIGEARAAARQRSKWYCKMDMKVQVKREF